MHPEVTAPPESNQGDLVLLYNLHHAARHSTKKMLLNVEILPLTERTMAKAQEEDLAQVIRSHQSVLAAGVPQ